MRMASTSYSAWLATTCSADWSSPSPTMYGCVALRQRQREATTQGLDIRYVVTSFTHGSAEWLYDSLYCARGQAENLIKLHKSQLASDRTSCRSPLANQLRLVLHTAAYW